MKNVFTIPAGAPFAKSLAGELLREAGEKADALPHYRIFLPTRRACRTLREAFLQLTDKPLLLPRLQPLGDIDGEELSFAAAGSGADNPFTQIPAAMPPLRRQILLAKLVERQGFSRGPDQDLALADALGKLLDQVYTEGLSLTALAALAPEKFADHWQITLKFLEILSEHWPKILQVENMIDAADRRNRLLRALAEFWAAQPPGFPVIAAGSTGSIPATAELLSVIASLKEGRVILPGLDIGTEQEDWDALDESHPQGGLKQLLARINMEREQVKTWPCADTAQSRRNLFREIMRPAATTGAWQNLSTSAEKKKIFAGALDTIKFFECSHEREEAETIALLLRETLETPGKTAALVTPDRSIARRVAAACRRWDIEIDDSAGQTLDQTPAGAFLRLTLRAALQEFSPVALLALLKHPLCQCNKKDVEILEKSVLRGHKPPAGLRSIAEKLDERHPPARELLHRLEKIFSGLEKKTKFETLLQKFLTIAEYLAGEKLWTGEDGEQASAFFAQLMEEGAQIPPLSLHNFAGALDVLMKAVTVRPSWGRHPRLMILGQLESRLTDADLIILTGLDEGIWPPDPGHDPWMSRPMRKDFGLPAPERSTGLAAHDFMQGFCAGETVLVYARRRGGTPTVPSRWLQRLDAVLNAAGMQGMEFLKDPRFLGWVDSLDLQGEIRPQSRPAPAPPVHKRPRKLSATRIETLMRDPYGIYARYILRLKKLEPLEKLPDAAERGQLLHTIMKRFTDLHPQHVPSAAAQDLQAIAADEIAKRHEGTAAWVFWWPRFIRIAEWVVDFEQGWRKTAKPLFTELRGEMLFSGPGGAFVIEATPDRIDKGPEGGLVIDYKSGLQFSETKLRAGLLPQLPVEALILQKGGFPGQPALPVQSLHYWILTGGAAPGENKAVARNMEQLLSQTEEGLQSLINAFDDPGVPYYSLPDPSKKPRFNDYHHLARVEEWTALEEGDAAEAA